tara:strand:- start:184 stop:687 length:504 start_codon:yes stop_codon:yes gene_type:complete
MPHTTLFCDWGAGADADLVAHAPRMLQYVVDTCHVVASGELLFVPEVDLVLRARRVASVPPSCVPECVATRRSSKSRIFALDVMVDLRERTVLKRGVPGAKRVYRRLDWHPEDSPGVMTCFVQLDGIATTSWRAVGLSHTLFQLCNPYGPPTGACVVVTAGGFYGAD